MITLAQLMRNHQAEFIKKHRSVMQPRHYQAMNAIMDCHTPKCGEVQYHCSPCAEHQYFCHSCGNRSCPACQHQNNNAWLDRQRQKLLPVDYYMVTFTLPAQLRNFVWHHQKWAYKTLFEVAKLTLATFAKNDKNLQATLGLTGVLHTHSRQLEFHPHIHFIVPNGGLSKDKTLWRQKPGEYLFNSQNIATVFRAKFIDAMIKKGYSLPANTPGEWVCQCKKVGKGEEALTYLARYLYRGVISEKNITHYDHGLVTFKYQDSDSKQWLTRTETATKFLWLVLQHVLPKGFRRARDYGFLHANAKKTLQRLQLILRVTIPVLTTQNQAGTKKKHLCPSCGLTMHMTQIFKTRKGIQPTS